ncbi:MAG: HAD-IA family hydrolase [Bacteroidales bacterium]|nr:HAD-IA family hydrolase [Bacteroidales bacterium]
MNRTYHHLLFDVDGTLLNSREAFTGSLEDALDRHGIAHGDISPYFTRTLAQFMADYAIADPTFLPSWNADYIARLAQAPLFDGVEHLLLALHEAGVTMGIVTSRVHDIALVGLAEKGLAHCFAEVVASTDVARPKPDPESIHLYMERHQAAASDILYVGDALTDRQCALAAGATFAAPAWAPLPPELLSDALGMDQILALASGNKNL